MLHLGYLGEAKKICFPKDCQKLLAVRKPVSGVPQGFIHAYQLSPSLPLFEQTQIWKTKAFSESDNVYLATKGIEREVDDSWWYLYENAFNQELKTRPDMVRGVERLCTRLTNGDEVFLFCYCKNVCRCHRGLVGKHIESMGYSVDFRKVNVREQEETKQVGTQLSLFDI